MNQNSSLQGGEIERDCTISIGNNRIGLGLLFFKKANLLLCYMTGVQRNRRGCGAGYTGGGRRISAGGRMGKQCNFPRQKESAAALHHQETFRHFFFGGSKSREDAIVLLELNKEDIESKANSERKILFL